MKITITNNKPVPFEDIAEGTVFRDPAGGIYYIKTDLVSVVDENSGPEKWNCLRLDNYVFDCFNPGYEVYPIYNAELIIP